MAPAVHFTLFALFITSAAAYTNHTVGGTAGWLFDPNTNTSSANYASWAANQTFDLGDYLSKSRSKIAKNRHRFQFILLSIIISDEPNQTVVLTYNETTFRSCSIDNSSDTDTLIYDKGSQEFGRPLTVEVPLTMEGSNYFFSNAGDGVPCENGMAFGINVSHGVGLPPSLNQPPPPAYVEPPSSADGGLTPPETVRPSGAGLGGGDNVRMAVWYALTFYGIFFALVRG
ncbi:hypothetical protein OSB04_008815 [Centaurea solstitialis]|uniref:Phytocyanin domain-containing protein n=1 Tax=Centaurea solstitialis TaxID=347529 RepID=A0AA38TMH9_9ASTR|nr:hypothetical protein OSB04_008815 [Centaurea solstitialis]